MKPSGRYVESNNTHQNGDSPVDVNVNAIPKTVTESTSYHVASGDINLAFGNPIYGTAMDPTKKPIPAGDINFDNNQIGFSNPGYNPGLETPYATIGPAQGDSMKEPLYESFPGDIEQPEGHSVSLDVSAASKAGSKA